MENTEQSLHTTDTLKTTENPKTTNEKSFRISAKRILLTYSQVNTEFSTNNVLEQLKYKLGRFSYIISKEAHSDGGTHFHVLLIHRRKFNVKNPYLLDLEINGKVAHGNYKPVNNLEYTVYYVCKDKQYITNLDNLQDGQLLTAKEYIYQQVLLKGVDKALLDYSQTHKEKALAGLSVSALKKHFADIQKIELSTKIDLIDTPFTLDNFNIDPPLREWIINPTKTLIIAGESGVGKTQFLKAVAKERCSKTLVVNHIEDFRRLNDTYDCILIDDANIDKLDDTQLLSLIDNQTGKTLRVMYDTVFRKKGIVQMIGMNKKEFNKIYPRLKENRMARRVVFHNVKKPFLVNANVDVYIQNHTIINNNYNYNKESKLIDVEQVQESEQIHIKQTCKHMDDYFSHGQD